MIGVCADGPIVDLEVALLDASGLSCYHLQTPGQRRALLQRPRALARQWRLEQGPELPSGAQLGPQSASQPVLTMLRLLGLLAVPELPVPEPRGPELLAVAETVGRVLPATGRQVR